MLENNAVRTEDAVDFLSCITFHGVPIRKGACVLESLALYRVLRIISCGSSMYLWMRLICAELTTDEHGMWVAHATEDVSHRLMSVNNGSDVTCVYTVPTTVPGCMSVIVKM